MYYQDLSGQLVEVGPGVVLYAPDAQTLQLIRSGEECPPSVNNYADLVTLASLLAEQDFVKARQLADKIADSMFMEPGSSLVVPNNNHMMVNPFKR